MHKTVFVSILISLTICGLCLAGAASGPTVAEGPDDQAGKQNTLAAGMIGALAGYRPTLDTPPLSTRDTTANRDTSQAGLVAVAIVGDVGSGNDSFAEDMDAAAAVLQGYGAEVRKFYYASAPFTWADVVAAAQGAHLLIYMGHGVYWGGDPLQVGGFYLGGNQFVTPDQIRNDLDGVVDEQSVVIFSHACFTAGDGGPGTISQSEAARRVQMYAQPFVDLGMQGYFANNYFRSAARTASLILSETAMGDAFKGSIAFDPARLVDLAHPAPGYDLWLDGAPGDWNLSFVGIPGHVFYPTPPALGNLPDELAFAYSIPDGRLVPVSQSLRPANVGNSTALTWQVTQQGSWFSVSPGAGLTPQTFAVAPGAFSMDTVATYTGVITVSVVDPAGVSSSPHPIRVRLDVVNAAIYDAYLPLIVLREGA
jgi:hypothetical protein